MKMRKYSFQEQLWKHRGKGGWHFVTLPKTLAVRIRKQHVFEEEGWGRLAVTAQINNCRWETAIWYDTKAKSYLLPVKAEIRKKQSLDTGNTVKVVLLIKDEERHTFLFSR